MKRTHTLTASLTGLLLLCGVVAPVEAGPWIREPGSAYLKLGAQYFKGEGTNAVLGTTEVSPELDYESVTWNLYAEVGVFDRLQLVADIPLVFGRNNSPTGVNYLNDSFGDARFEVDYSIYYELPLALGVEVKVPLYDRVTEQVDSGDFAYPQLADNFPDAGDGNIDITPKLLIGHSFHPVPAWVTGELGYRHRFDDFVDGIFAAASVGWFVWPEHIAIGAYGNTVINVASDDQNITKEIVYTQGYLLITAAPVAKDLALTIAGGRTTSLSDEFASGTDGSVGVSYAW